jgi:hypothetical protein
VDRDEGRPPEAQNLFVDPPGIVTDDPGLLELPQVSGGFAQASGSDSSAAIGEMQPLCRSPEILVLGKYKKCLQVFEAGQVIHRCHPALRIVRLMHLAHQ